MQHRSDAKLAAAFLNLAGSLGEDELDMGRMREHIFAHGFQGHAEKLAEKIGFYRRKKISGCPLSAEAEKALGVILQDAYVLFLASIAHGPGLPSQQEGGYGPITQELTQIGYYTSDDFSQSEKG